MSGKLVLSFSEDDCSEVRKITITDENIIKSLITKSEKDIVNILNFSTHLDSIPSLHREDMLRGVKEYVRDGNTEMKAGLEMLCENILALTSGNSAQLGKFNEHIIEKYLGNHFPHYDIVNTSVSGDKCGDIVINTHTNMGRISIESKNYGPDRSIPSSEIDKFKRDLMNSGIKFGIFVSTNSRISGKNTIDYEVFEDKIIVYLGPAGHDCSLMNLAIHYLVTINELDAVHTRRLTTEDNKGFRDKMVEISKVFETNLIRLNTCSNNINETEKKLNSLMCNLRKDIQIIISDFNVHLEKLQNDVIEMKEGSNREYSTYDELIDIIRNGRPDKNANKQMALERFVTLLNNKDYQMKLDENHIYFYRDEIYVGKIHYKGKSRIDIFFKEYSDFSKPYNRKIVTMKNDNYIIELKDNSETWDFINEKI